MSGRLDVLVIIHLTCQSFSMTDLTKFETLILERMDSQVEFLSNLKDSLSGFDKRLAVLESRTENLVNMNERVHKLELQLTEIKADFRVGQLDRTKIEEFAKRLDNLEKSAGVDSGKRKIILDIVKWAIPSAATIISIAALLLGLARDAAN